MNGQQMPTGFRCSSCGEWHDELPLDFGFGEPDYIAELDAEARQQFAKGVGDFRELLRDGHTHYFIRGVIEIPIIGTTDSFCYGVWSSLSEQSYEAAKNAYRTNSDAGPFFGWLSNRVPYYPDTLRLKTNVHVRAQTRSAIELEPTDHPLAIEQREGITMERVQQIISRVLHPSA
jgi:hypothetical protein